jgi:RimJ/RimL family protein N-acetyltransferase
MEDTPTLYTERLILRPLQLADADAVQQLFPHCDVVRYLNAAVPWPYPEDGAEHWLAQTFGARRDALDPDR